MPWLGSRGCVYVAGDRQAGGRAPTASGEVVLVLRAQLQNRAVGNQSLQLSGHFLPSVALSVAAMLTASRKTPTQTGMGA